MEGKKDRRKEIYRFRPNDKSLEVECVGLRLCGEHDEDGLKRVGGVSQIYTAGVVRRVHRV